MTGAAELVAVIGGALVLLTVAGAWEQLQDLVVGVVRAARGAGECCEHCRQVEALARRVRELDGERAAGS